MSMERRNGTALRSLIAGFVLAASLSLAAIPLPQAQELEWATSAGGAGEPNETALEAQPSFDIFVAKYAPDGDLVWATSAGGDGPDYGLAIATDAHGNSYVTGSFNGTATSGEGEGNETLLEGMQYDVFVTKYRDQSQFW
jgi:hypothetical protein